ncbi:MAG: hypothetical protein JO191_00895, partial [Mycobacteriaceae bacterium]|nr:hypothetical protein [Mycobacteriaceae bacterium]
MALTLTGSTLFAAGCHAPASLQGAPVPGAPAVTPGGSPSGSPAATPRTVDYTHLLITPRDILAPDDSYVAAPTQPNPAGTQGAEVLLTNQDQTRAIGDSIVILPDAAAAPSALQQATAALRRSVIGGDPQRAPGDTGGTVVSGTAPDQSKAVTILLFTEGRAFVRLEFDSASGTSTAPDFVADVAQK